jgi:small subunit ribosomal protein S1
MSLMKKFLEENVNFKPVKIGDIVYGKVISKKAFAIYLDLGIFGTGIIYGKEFKKAKKELKNVKVGDKILAKVVDLDNEEGFIELSVAGAEKEIAIDSLRKKKEAGEKIKVQILGANKGGLLTKISGVDAFLPISQLSLENYPKVEDGNQEKILEHLKKFIGKEMEVKILGILEKDAQVILSEKLAKEEKEIEEYKIGDVVEVEVAGITDFGVFVKFGNNLEGLVPISEIDENFNLKLGEKVKAKIVSIENKKPVLSLKI